MNIGKAAVLGAGTMGAGIAAHLANAEIVVARQRCDLEARIRADDARQPRRFATAS